MFVLKQSDFWTDTKNALKNAYQTTDKEILDQSLRLGKGGSTAVTAILINGQKLVVANVGDSRAVISKKGVARQLSVDHEPSKEKKLIESKGGFVSNLPGTYQHYSTSESEQIKFILESIQNSHALINYTCSVSITRASTHTQTLFSPKLVPTGDVPRVDGQLAVARAFGDKSLKRHLSSEPDIAMELIDDDVEFVILASDGLWKV